VSLKDIILSGPLGIDVIPSGSGIASLTRLSYVQQQQIIDQISSIDKSYDVIFIDTGAGIADNVTHFCRSAHKVLVVTTPEPHALTDAYALIKVLAENHDIRQPNLLINQTRSEGEGLKMASRISEVALRFLNVQVSYAGNVPSDPQVTKSVMQRRAASEQSTHTIAGQAWSQVARKLVGNLESPQSSDVQEFWRCLLWQEPVRAEGAK
jgi:flagellar biosynthesis protein FlhG